MFAYFFLTLFLINYSIFKVIKTKNTFIIGHLWHKIWFFKRIFTPEPKAKTLAGGKFSVTFMFLLLPARWHRPIVTTKNVIMLSSKAEHIMFNIPTNKHNFTRSQISCLFRHRGITGPIKRWAYSERYFLVPRLTTTDLSRQLCHIWFFWLRTSVDVTY
jgi:hypothetical protein